MASTENSRVRPIVVIGMNRSGTKWLSGILGRNPDVVAPVTRKEPRGILETNMFGPLPDRFPDLCSDDDYIGLIELWSQSRLFRLLGIEKRFFWHLKTRPRNCFELFETAMQEAARRQRKRFWLQKTDPLQGKRALAYYPGATVVLTRRNMLDVVKSSMRLKLRQGECPSLLRTVFFFVLEKKLLSGLARKHGHVVVDYERLCEAPAAQIREVCRFIGLKYGDGMLDVPRYFNTSFRHSGERKTFLSPTEERRVRLLAGMYSCVPVVFLKWIHDQYRRKHVSCLVEGTFDSPLARGNERRTGRDKAEFPHQMRA